MATEHVLRLRITNAAEAAQRAVARNDERAYYRAKAVYEDADRALRELEAVRNRLAIEELEAEAHLYGGVLPYASIMRAGVPAVVLLARGWRSLDDRSGMHRPPHLSLVPNNKITQKEAQHGAAAANSGDTGADEAGRPQAHEP